jgi:hypothetical protein
MVDGKGWSLPCAMPRIVFRKIFPERVFGSAATTSTDLKHATAPISLRTAATSCAARLEKLAVRVGALRAGHRGVVDQRRLLGAAVGNMPIQRVRAGVQLAVGKPAVKRWIGVVEHTPRLTDPGHCPRGVGPESRRVFDACIEDPTIFADFRTARRRRVSRIHCTVGHFVVLVLMRSGHDGRGLLECIHIDGRSVEPLDPARRP